MLSDPSVFSQQLSRVGYHFKGNLQVVDASPTVRAVSLHDSLEWGLYISGSGEPVVSEVTYSGNGSGECSGCP